MRVANQIYILAIMLFVARGFVLQSSRSRSLQRNYGRFGFAIARHMSNGQQNESSSDTVSTDQFEEYRNKNNMRDQVFSAMSEDGSIKVTACTARNVVNDLMIMHTMTAVPADALSR